MFIIYTGIGYITYKDNEEFNKMSEEEKIKHWESTITCLNYISESVNDDDIIWGLDAARY